MHCEKMVATDMFHHRAVIEFPAKGGNLTGVIYRQLCYVYRDACMGASSVKRWLRHFKGGNTDVTDQPRCGQPRTAATGHTKQKVDKLVRHDPMKTDKLQCNLEWHFMKNVQKRKM
jgi:transposase